MKRIHVIEQRREGSKRWTPFKFEYATDKAWFAHYLKHMTRHQPVSDLTEWRIATFERVREVKR